MHHSEKGHTQQEAGLAFGDPCQSGLTAPGRAPGKSGRCGNRFRTPHEIEVTRPTSSMTHVPWPAPSACCIRNNNHLDGFRRVVPGLSSRLAVRRIWTKHSPVEAHLVAERMWHRETPCRERLLVVPQGLRQVLLGRACMHGRAAAP